MSHGDSSSRLAGNRRWFARNYIWAGVRMVKDLPLVDVWICVGGSGWGADVYSE